MPNVGDKTSPNDKKSSPDAEKSSADAEKSSADAEKTSPRSLTAGEKLILNLIEQMQQQQQQMQNSISSLVELKEGRIRQSDKRRNEGAFLKFIRDMSPFHDTFCTHGFLDIRPNKVYVRESYKKLWQLSQKEKLAVVKGNPGVGKSVFMLYCIRQLVHNRHSFAFSHDFLRFFVYVTWEEEEIERDRQEESQHESQCTLELEEDDDDSFLDDLLSNDEQPEAEATNAEPVQSDHDIETSDYDEERVRKKAIKRTERKGKRCESLVPAEGEDDSERGVALTMETGHCVSEADGVVECKGSKDSALEPQKDDVNKKPPIVRFFNSFDAMASYVNEKNTFLLIDNSVGQVPSFSFKDYKSALICSSPGVAYMRLQDLESSSLYMPVWPLSEIFKVEYELLGGAFAVKDEGKILLEKRFKILGGIPRYLFASAQGFRKIVQRLHSQIKNTSNLLELLKDFISSPVRLDVTDLPHLLLHLEIRNDNYREYYYNIASKHIQKKVFENENLKAATVLDAFVDRVLSADMAPMNSVAGRVHEARFRFFMCDAVGKHVKFSACPLVQSAQRPRDFDIELTGGKPIDGLSEHLESALEKVEKNAFVEPTAKNFPVIDFLVTPNWLFQLTVGSNHSTKPEKMCNVLKAIHNRYGVNEAHLIYVVAPGVLKSWKEKNKALYDADENGFFSYTKKDLKSGRKDDKSGRKKARTDLTMDGFTLREYFVSMTHLSCAVPPSTS